MTELDLLLQELRGEGQLDSRGQFQLDAAKAREKLAERQLREAGLWITKLVQCAHLWQARRRELRRGRAGPPARLWLGNQVPDAETWLGHIHEIEFLAHPLWGPLTMAFQAALADGCEWVQFQSWRLDENGCRPLPAVTLAPEDQWELTFHYRRREPWWNPWLQLRPPRRALENFLAASRKAGLALPELEMDRYRPRHPLDTPTSSSLVERLWLSSDQPRELMHYPQTLVQQARLEEVAGRIFAPPQQSAGLRQWRHEQARELPLPQGGCPDWLEGLAARGHLTSMPGRPGIRGLIRWNLNGSEPARLTPVKHGITLEAVPRPSLPTGVEIWLASSLWKTDLNQRRLLREGSHRPLLDWAIEEFDQFWGELPALSAANPALAELRHRLHRLGRPPLAQEPRPLPLGAFS